MAYSENARRVIDPANIRTRGVYAAAYRGKDLDDRALRTHAVDLTTMEALCRKGLNVVDDSEAYTEEEQRGIPTCPVCAEKDPRFFGASAEDFMSALESALNVGDRRVVMRFSNQLGTTGAVYVNLINLPAGIGGAGGGAEAENNRMSFSVGRFPKDPAGPVAEVTVELGVSALPREFKLRSKSGPPRAIAKYLAEFINRVVAEVPPKFTHTKMEPNGGASKRDLAQAIQYMEESFEDFPSGLSPEQLIVTDVEMIPVADLEQYDDLGSWVEVDPGELTASGGADALGGFRGEAWAGRAQKWRTPEDMPPIVIMDSGTHVAIADGRGRVNYAIGMGWQEIPAVKVAPDIAEMEPNARFARTHEDALVQDPGLMPNAIAKTYVAEMKRVLPRGTKVAATASRTTMPRSWTHGNVTTLDIGGSIVDFVLNVHERERDFSGQARLNDNTIAMARNDTWAKVVSTMCAEVAGHLTPSEMEPNGGHYVWVVNERDEPLNEGPFGPYDRRVATTVARIQATEGAHNRAVSRGLHPDAIGFAVIRKYEAGTGNRLI